jgi:hypothetical protein
METVNWMNAPKLQVRQIRSFVQAPRGMDRNCRPKRFNSFISAVIAKVSTKQFGFLPISKAVLRNASNQRDVSFFLIKQPVQNNFQPIDQLTNPELLLFSAKARRASETLQGKPGV